MADKEVDLLIVGGGLTGVTLMLAMEGLGYSTLLVEAKPFSEKAECGFDARSLALSPASKNILSTLGVWPCLKPYATGIEMIHVSEQHRFGLARFHANEQGPLGYVIEIHHMARALCALLKKDRLMTSAMITEIDMEQKQAKVNTPSGEVWVQAQMIIAADGATSMIRQFCHLATRVKDYQQSALVANIGLEKPHAQRAYERFTLNGPLALLPMQANRMSLVWANPPSFTEQLLAQSDTEFLNALQLAFGYRLGRFIKVGKRQVFPLQQVLMTQQVKWPVVFVGNAAHTLHPVAGQGFNLGLRDIAALAQCINQYGVSKEALNAYLQCRSHDQKVITHLTDGLIQLFTSRLPGVGIARNLGLVALDSVPVLKKMFAYYATGFGGMISDLVCEIGLNPQEMNP